MSDKKDNYIEIANAKVHNLKGVSLKIPRNEFVVITGVSGSGKSSLAFDTLYAEGQRRYVESLSSYARQFMGRINKPEVDYIRGIPPAIAIEQKVNTRNPRSTVGTSTEIYEYMRLLYARIGKTYSPVSGKEVKKDRVTDVVDFIVKKAKGEKIMILAPVKFEDDTLERLKMRGYSRIICSTKEIRLNEIEDVSTLKMCDDVFLVVDRVIGNDDEDNVSRMADSIETAFFEGHGACTIMLMEQNEVKKDFSNRFELDGILFEEPNEHFFSFNSPLGACRRCDGYGQTIGIDPDLVIPDKSLSIYEDAVACWRGEKMSEWKDELINSADKFDFPIHRPFFELSDEQKDLVWNGNQYFAGIHKFFEYLEKKAYKIQYRVMLSKYRGKTICPECKGSRLRKDAQYVKVGGKSIGELVEMPVIKLLPFIQSIEFNEYDKKVSERILQEIENRLSFLINVGLGYLTISRQSSTLSGGESQRINLATSLGSSLVGSLYILDEPSIGLHPRDTHNLINVLKELKNLGNTVVVVEHEEEFMHEADQIIDIGPLAGAHGGEVVFQGTQKDLVKSEVSLTAAFLTGKEEISLPSVRRKGRNFLKIEGARHHNLKNIDVSIQLQSLSVITGVSGSGKSSLIRNILFPALQRKYQGYSNEKGDFKQLSGDFNIHKGVEFVDQNPIGKSSRSNPVTYLKAYDEIRSLFASQQLSKQQNFKPAHFSFNVDGGRCDECQGEGTIKVEMQFMADVELICEACKGRRFKDEILEVKYKEKSIFDVLEMTIEEAVEFFGKEPKGNAAKVARKLQPLLEVGLGYVKMGQSSSTLSGGESQRVKLASFLAKDQSADSLIFIFDEPTTGLHFHDINKLLKSFNALIEKGHSIIVIEHNPEVVKSADWIVDLGPEGGEGGGELVFEGTPEELAKCKKSYTGKFIAEKLGD
ncbi:MAG: excinuclease ABC subunit A [Salinivirgaceae bacterium]|nr:MAG: excinuclease ABC subunit A [Salinivirgaceae bacterium]